MFDDLALVLVNLALIIGVLLAVIVGLSIARGTEKLRQTRLDLINNADKN